MKNYAFFALLFSSFFFLSDLVAQCDPIPDNPMELEQLARTPRPLKEMIGANAGFEIEHFDAPDATVNLGEVSAGLSFIRFFYQHDKDYYNNRAENPADRQRLPVNLDFSTIPTREELIDAKYFWNNYIRVEAIKNGGLKVHAAVEISTRRFPDKWWRVNEIDNNDTPNYNNVRNKGEDWANAFLRVYDPKNASGSGFEFSSPMIDILELGNEPWGDPGIQGYINYTQGMIDAFKEYYGDNPNNFRIKLASAAFQDHEPESPIFDIVGEMVSPASRTYLTEGIGVHNYNKVDYCEGSINNVTVHPEADGGGFGIYKNMSEWVKNNMPVDNQKLNATEFGWASDDEPSRVFDCNDIDNDGICEEPGEVDYSTVVAINYPGCDWNYATNSCGALDKQGIGRTAQAAYIVRSTLMLHRWGANQAAIYQLRDDWRDGTFYSYGLIDKFSPRTLEEYEMDLNGETPNIGGKKESWHALNRTVSILGSRHFLNYYGEEPDEGLYCYVYGNGTSSSSGRPTHMVLWWATGIGEEYKNNENDEGNISDVEALATEFSLADLEMPEGLEPNIEGRAIYLDGREETRQIPVSEIYNEGNVKVSPIPIVVPLSPKIDFCINFYTGEVAKECKESELCADAGGDLDGDGICQIKDCDDKDPNVPTDPGTPCNDGDPATVNDIIQNDGCTCEGTPKGGNETTIECNGAEISYGNGTISVTILSGESTTIAIYDVDNGWNDIVNEWGNAVSVSNLPAGTYRIRIGRVLCEAIRLEESSSCEGSLDGGQIGFGNDCLSSHSLSSCPNNGPNILNCSSPFGTIGVTIQYLWLKSTTTFTAPDIPFINLPSNSEWEIIPNANSPSYNPGNISQTTYYIRAVKFSDCDEYTALSNVIGIFCGGGGSNILLSCPNNITVTAAPSSNGAIVTWNEPTANTSCNGGGLNITQISGLSSGSIFPIGTTTIGYQATDNCGSISNCSFNVIVQENSDNGEAPDNYCSSSGSTPWQQWIERVSFGSIDNESEKDLYGDFTHLSTEVQMGQDYIITLKPGFSWQEFALHWRVWIDFNRDGDFEDANEKVLESTSNTTIQSNIIIPNNASLGATRMRVSMRKEDYTEPCDLNFGNGEVEDYTIRMNNNFDDSSDEVGERSNNSLPETVPASSIQLYPNPTTGLLHLNLGPLKGKKTTIQIVSQLGKIVKQFQIGEQDNFPIVLNLQDLNSGFYFLQIQSNTALPIVKRLVISKK